MLSAFDARSLYDDKAESLDEDASIEQAIDRLHLLQTIEIGRQQIAAGDFIDHDEFMRELEAEDQE